MILVTLSVVVPPNRRQEMQEVFWMLQGPLQVQPGCRVCALYQEVGNEGLLYVEEWETLEQLERHMRSCRYDRLLALMEASAEPPVLRYHLVSDIRGLEYLEAVRLGAAAVRPPPAPSSPPDCPHEPDRPA